MIRLPLRALPVAIRAVKHMRGVARSIAYSLDALHADLVDLRDERWDEPEDVSDLVPDRTCFECGTSDPTGFCPAHRVLDKGRVN